MRPVASLRLDLIMRIKFVLTVATFSEGSENALERAAELAAQHRALLYVLHRPSGAASHPIDTHYRIALRSLQLARRYGVEVRPLPIREKRLSRMLERKAQELVLVIDPATARQLSTGSGLLRNLVGGFPRGRRFLDLRTSPILLVKRPVGDGNKLALLPYRAEHEAARSLAFAQVFAANCKRELFFVGPPGGSSPASLPTPEDSHLREWPPPASQRHATARIEHSDYLSTRLNRAIPAFDIASKTRRIKNQASFSAADLVITPYAAPSFAERLLRTSLRDRLSQDLHCDLLFLPDPDCQRTALTASDRLRPQRPVALRLLAAVKESVHG